LGNFQEKKPAVSKVPLREKPGATTAKHTIIIIRV